MVDSGCGLVKNKIRLPVSKCNHMRKNSVNFSVVLEADFQLLLLI